MQAVSRTVSGSSFWRFHRWMYMRAYVHTYAHIRIVVPLNENSCGTVWVPIIKLNWDGLPFRFASFYEYIYIWYIYICMYIYMYVYVCLIIVDSVTLKSSLIIVDSHYCCESHYCWFCTWIQILTSLRIVHKTVGRSFILVCELDSQLLDDHQPTITCHLPGL